MALDQFRAIAPPPADRAEIAHYQAGIEANRVLLGRVARAARAGDLAAYEALVARQDERTRRNRRFAQSYGFRECGRL